MKKDPSRSASHSNKSLSLSKSEMVQLKRETKKEIERKESEKKEGRKLS